MDREQAKKSLKGNVDFINTNLLADVLYDNGYQIVTSWREDKDTFPKPKSKFMEEIESAFHDSKHLQAFALIIDKYKEDK